MDFNTKNITSLIVCLSVLLMCSPKNDYHTTIESGEKDTVKPEKKYPDSTEFWYSDQYMDCIHSGTPVCGCLAKNQFVMLFINPEKTRIIVQSSIFFFGQETSAEYDMIKIHDDSLKYVVRKSWPLDDSLLIDLSNNKLYLLYAGNIYPFTRKWFKTAEIPEEPKGIFTYQSEIWSQRNILNAQSLLSYPYTDNNDPIFSPEELKTLIKNNCVFISCSDDFHYNSMYVKQGDSTRSYHLEYSEGKVTIYEESPRGRDRLEEINLTGLKQQVFYRKAK